jgi:hypothetical protein
MTDFKYTLNRNEFSLYQLSQRSAILKKIEVYVSRIEGNVGEMLTIICHISIFHQRSPFSEATINKSNSAGISISYKKAEKRLEKLTGC